MTPIELQGNTAVKELRRLKLSKGSPFMINANELPALQCYLEYPDGKISLVKLASNRHDFILIRELSAQEARQIRTRYGLN